MQPCVWGIHSVYGKYTGLPQGLEFRLIAENSSEVLKRAATRVIQSQLKTYPVTHRAGLGLPIN
jgi:hypothetical protein